MRRPGFPTTGLTRALESTFRLWQEAGQSAFPPEAAVRALGFKSLSGPARSHLSALKQYGLIEDAGKDRLRLSPLAKAIVAHPEGSDEQSQAIKEAALTPPLFAELWRSYSTASDGIIKAHLIASRNQNEEAARSAIKAYRDSIGRARLDPQLDEPDAENVDRAAADIESDDVSAYREEPTIRRFAQTFVRRERPADVRRERPEELIFRLAPDIQVALRFLTRKQITQKDIDLLIQLLDLQKSAYPVGSDTIGD